MKIRVNVIVFKDAERSYCFSSVSLNGETKIYLVLEKLTIFGNVNSRDMKFIRQREIILIYNFINFDHIW